MILIADCHADTLSRCLDDSNSLKYKKYSFNLIYAKSGFIQCLAAYVSPRFLPDGFGRACDIIDKFYKEYEENKDRIILLDNLESLNNFRTLDKIGVILTVENGSAINGNLTNVDKLYDSGIRIMGITWNDDNDLACANETNDDKGLTQLGKDYIKKLNDENIIIDVSHVSDKSFFDVINVTNKPIIATHSNARSVCDNRRNLTDEQIKKIAEFGGIIGVCFYSRFLSNNKRATLDDIIKHIVYISNLVGVEHVAFGSDFDGMEKRELPRGVKNAKSFDIILNKMLGSGFSEKEIALIAGENFYNFYKRQMLLA